MPAVIKMGEKLFQDQFYEDFNPQPELLSTIRVPKNLLYLTDRLPKPNYDSTERGRNHNNRSQNVEDNSETRRAKQNIIQANLPDIKKSKHQRNKHK